MSNSSLVRSRTLQLRRFAAVGVLNTLLDYVLFVALTRILRLSLEWVWVAKAISGTTAMSISFYLNRRWVFRAGGGTVPQATKFVATTAIGVYAIQTPLTQLFASGYPGVGRALYRVLVRSGFASALSGIVTETLVIKTAAFALATAVSMTFNFLLYRFWVFRAPEPS